MTGRRTRGAATGPPADLLRLNRHSRCSLLVLGGTDEERLGVALAFHRASPVRHGPFIALDCAREEPRLWRALQFWLTAEGALPAGDPLRESERGTLYLDSVACLSAPTQRLLLVIARRLACDPSEPWSSRGPFRLAVGNTEDLDETVELGHFSGALYDSLDKIRVQLDQTQRSGAA